MPAPKRRLTVFAVAMAVLIATPLVVGASDTFTDVPDSNVHHNDITWLADAGVTLGCNPPDNTNFCPESPVLRQQMASFLRRLAENQVVDAATAVTAANADALGGKTLDEVQSAVFGQTCTNDCSDTTTVMSMDIEPPGPGVVQFDYSLTIDNNEVDDDPQFAWIAAGDTCTTIIVVIIVLPGNAISGSLTQTALNSNQVSSLSGTTAVSVPAGQQTFSLCQLSYSGDFSVVRGTLTGVWAPSSSSVPIASGDNIVTFSEEEIDALSELIDS